MTSPLTSSTLSGPTGGQAHFLDLETWASLTPEAVAVASPGRSPLTYSTLWNHMHATSDELCRAGLRPGTVAALALPSEPCFITAVLAVTLQAACTPLDPNLTADECQSYLQRIGASTLVVPHGTDSRVAEVAHNLGMNVVRICAAKESSGLFSLAEVHTSAREFTARHTDAAFILLTSSTTGAPKLVPWSRANVRAMTLQDVRAFELSGQDRFLALMAFHASHSIYTLLTQLACGGSVACPGSLDAASTLAAFESFRPTWTSGGPTTHRMLLGVARENPAIFRQIPLRFMRSAGAPPEQGLLNTLETVLGVPVLDSYGLTEIPGVARNTPSQRKDGSLGRSVGADIAIMDDSGNLQPPETPGEIVARGPTLMSGYLDNPEANEEAFHDGWFRTGDIGRLDHDGFLFLAGRKKEMINRGGTKISPREVDDVLLRHPAVVDVAVFGIPHRTLGEDVAAAVVLKAGAEASELELRRHTSEHLATYKVPRRIVFVESVPRTALGKPKRAELSDLFGTMPATSTAVQPGSTCAQRAPTEIETQLIVVWSQVLGVEEIGLEDTFFDLGGDSLTASLMLAKVEADLDLGGHIDGSAFFDQPTIGMLARIVTDHAPRAEIESFGANRILLLEKDGDLNPFFCFSDNTISPYHLRHLSRELGPRQPFVAICPPRADQSNRVLNAHELASQSVAAIREMRKHGPYLIGGYCYGGVLAFEAALQLIEQGEEVSLLVLLDTPTPGYPKILRSWKRYVRRAAELLHELAHGKLMITTKDILAHLDAIGRIVGRRFGAKANRTLGTPTPNSPQPEQAWNSIIMREYVPRSFPSRIVQFLASDVLVSTAVLSDPRLGWRDFACGGFQTYTVRGDHVSLLEKDNVPGLAADLERLFKDAAQSAALRR